SPVDGAPADKLVLVHLTVSFASNLPAGCYAVTDLLPSGLAPVVNVPGWAEDPDVPRDPEAPYAADGQRVFWCVDPTLHRTVNLAYAARVVTPGSYRWEPAVIQSVTSPGLGAATAASIYTIR